MIGFGRPCQGGFTTGNRGQTPFLRSQQDIGRFFGRHYAQVRQIVTRERKRAKGEAAHYGPGSVATPSAVAAPRRSRPGP